MAEILNLRLARKRKAREEKDDKAAANRAKFGQSKAERDKKKAVGTLETKRLDGHFRGPRDGDAE